MSRNNVILSVERVESLICISAAGVGPGRDLNLPFIFDRIFKPLVLGRTFADMYRMEQIIISTDVNYFKCLAAIAY